MAGRLKKAGAIVCTVFIYAFFALCLFLLLITILGKKNVDGGAQLFGYQMRVVVSPSMEKCAETDVSGYKIKDIPVKSMVFVKVAPEDAAGRKAFYDSLTVGDVLTFRYVSTKYETVTHRVVSLTEKEGGYIVTLAGDNRNAGSAVVTQTIDTTVNDGVNYIIGRVTGQSRALGWLVTAVKSPTGMLFMIIVPCSVIVVFEIAHIVGLVHSSRQKRATDAQAEEIETLKRQLAALRNGADATAVNDAATTADANKEE